jgi:MYXO-CTERM domain-containing protein
MNLSTPADKPWLPGGMLLAGFGLPLAWRRRRDIAGMRYNGLPVLVVLLAVGLQSCGGGSGPAAVSGSNTGSSSGSTGTPAGAYTVTITATAGLITQSTTYALTVQ